MSKKMIDSETVHENLKNFLIELEKKAGNKRQLALGIGVDRKAVIRWLNGSFPQLNTVVAIATYADLSLIELGAILEGVSPPLPEVGYPCLNRGCSSSKEVMETVNLEPKARRRLTELWFFSLEAQGKDSNWAIAQLQQSAGLSEGSARTLIALLEEDMEANFYRHRLALLLPLLRRVQRWHGDRPIVSDCCYENLDDLLADLDRNGSPLKV